MSLSKYVVALVATCFCCSQAFAQTLYNCVGDFDYATTDVTVDLNEGWAAMSAQLELDDTSGCKSHKDVDDGFLCTKKDNLITSRIDDDSDFSTQFTSPLGDPWSGQATATGPDTYAVVHMDVFMPGDCAVPLAAGAAECDGNELTTDDVCYESASGDLFDSAEESCADTYEFNGEGMFAEGDDLSTNRQPKSGKNRNWAMEVALVAPACDAVLTDDPTDCDFAGEEVPAIADGGDFGEPGAVEDVDYLNVGTVTFMPEDNCQAVEQEL